MVPIPLHAFADSAPCRARAEQAAPSPVVVVRTCPLNTSAGPFPPTDRVRSFHLRRELCPTTCNGGEFRPSGRFPKSYKGQLSPRFSSFLFFFFFLHSRSWPTREIKKPWGGPGVLATGPLRSVLSAASPAPGCATFRSRPCLFFDCYSCHCH